MTPDLCYSLYSFDLLSSEWKNRYLVFISTRSDHLQSSRVSLYYEPLIEQCMYMSFFSDCNAVDLPPISERFGITSDCSLGRLTLCLQ
jgi:hypothetical protein